MSMKPVKIVLPEGLWRQVSIRAAEEGVHKHILVARALEHYLDTKEAPK